MGSKDVLTFVLGLFLVSVVIEIKKRGFMYLRRNDTISCTKLGRNQVFLHIPWRKDGRRTGGSVGISSILLGRTLFISSFSFEVRSMIFSFRWFRHWNLCSSRQSTQEEGGTNHPDPSPVLDPRIPPSSALLSLQKEINIREDPLLRLQGRGDVFTLLIPLPTIDDCGPEQRLYEAPTEIRD